MGGANGSLFIGGAMVSAHPLSSGAAAPLPLPLRLKTALTPAGLLIMHLLLDGKELS